MKGFQVLDRRLGQRDPLVTVLWRVGIVAGSACLVIGACSAYRAWVQVYALELSLRSDTLRAGTSVGLRAVTSGRTPVDVVLELVQPPVAETLGVWRLPNSRDPATDPRPQRIAPSLGLHADQLRGFAPGPARLRAMATGRPQWTRLPPPTVVERAVVVGAASSGTPITFRRQPSDMARGFPRRPGSSG